MARGTQLSQLVVKLKAKIHDSSSVSLSVDKQAEYKELLREAQEFYYEDYDWPHLTVFTSKAIVAGSRYYDFPATITYEGIREVAVTWNSEPHPVTRGIGFPEYAQFEPDDNERSDPILNWDVRWTGSKEQIEVWPLPASASTLRFRAVRTLPDLLADGDTAVLDDRLIVGHAATKILFDRESEDAKAVAGETQRLYARLRGRAKAAGPTIQYGGGTPGRRRHRDHVTIAISS